MAKTPTTTKTTKKTALKAIAKPDNKALYAVFASGGKQYRVVVGDKVKIEKLNDNQKEGDKLTFDKVLLVDDGISEATIGTPFIKGAEVKATLKKIARYKTIDVIKYKQKSRYFKKYGHRQPYFEIQIDSIK
ncbi:MAG: 50S ribosomal protein L21 [Patescibacteria group bacterium]